MAQASQKPVGEQEKTASGVVYKLCDLQRKMVVAWKEIFKEFIPERVQVTSGDIFKNGPAADAIVSPANSFGFMDGGIDMAYSRHFGWQLQERLQNIIRTEYDGELLVGQAIILPTEDKKGWVKKDWSQFNEGQPIKYLISAPTMRAPWDVSGTPNAYLAFRAVILAVKKFNADPKNELIRSVLVPGLGTAVGLMPCDRCAFQMLHAYEIHELGRYPELIHPQQLWTMMSDQVEMVEFGNEAKSGRKQLKTNKPSDKGASKESEESLEKPKSITELRETLEKLVPQDSLSEDYEELETKDKQDDIPSVLDPNDIV